MPNLLSIASISSFAQILWKITSSAVKVVYIDTNGNKFFLEIRVNWTYP